MDAIRFCLCVVALLLLRWLWNVYRLRSQLPPGPWPFPFVGNLLQLDLRRPQNTCLKWSKQYGPVFTIWKSNTPMVMVTDYEMMKDALVKHGDQLSGRPRQFAIDYFTGGNFGVVNSSGGIWKEQRRFSLHTLRNFGLGRNMMEERVLHEASKMTNWIEEDLAGQHSKELNVSILLQLCVGNVISAVMLGHSFDRTDEKFLSLKVLLDESLHFVATKRFFMVNSFPWLRFLPILNHFGLDDIERCNKQFMAFLNEELDQHKRAFKECDRDEEPTDFIMAYLKEMARRQESGEDMSYFSDWQLLHVLSDLWVAGMETTVTTLRWGMLAMMINPDVQRKVHEEIDQVLGQHKPPSMGDMRSMPYVTATLNEMQRWGNILPINISHTNETEFDLAGHRIPPNVEVVPQISVLNIDERIFPSPERFLPERFLNKDAKAEQFAPFSMGKRQCLGESLARMELFLIFVSFMQKFLVSVVPGESSPSLQPLIGITSSPEPFQCYVSCR